jgi:hypothetical protein
MYCNVTTFDWTKPWVRQFWVDTVYQFIQSGVVDGIFADHSGQWGNGIGIGSGKRGDAPNQLCNGVGKRRQCFNFTLAFCDSFNSWHDWATNYTQDVLSKTTRGPVIQGPHAVMRGLDPCNFHQVRQASHGRYAIVEAWQCKPSRACLAAFLTAVEPGVYLHCLYSGEDLIPTSYFPEIDYPLGSPHGPAHEVPHIGSGVWERTFGQGVVATWDDVANTGDVVFPGRIPPPPPAAEIFKCEPGLAHTTRWKGQSFAFFNLRHRNGVETALLCCSFCSRVNGCTKWSWHVDQYTCHCHGPQATGPRPRQGVVAGEFVSMPHQ